MGVLGRRDHAPRLVDRGGGAVGRWRHGPGVDADGHRAVDVARGVGDDLAAHPHPPVGDQGLRRAPRGDAGMGQVLGEPHLLCIVVDLDVLDRALAGEPKFRAAQVWDWVARGAASYEAMTNVPAALREHLAATVPYSTLHVGNEARSKDGTIKTLFSTAADGRPVEAVLMR